MDPCVPRAEGFVLNNERRHEAIKISNQKMVSEDILAVHRGCIFLINFHFQAGPSPIHATAAPKCITTSRCFPSPAGSCTPSWGSLPPSPAPWHPRHVLSVCRPPGMPTSLSQSSTPPNPALKAEPMKASHVGLLKAGRRARCRHVLGRRAFREMCQFRRLSHGLSSLPLPFRQFACYINERVRAPHLLLLVGAHCRAVRLQEAWRLLGAWLELREDTTSPGVRGGDSRKNAGTLCAALGGGP